MKFDTTDEDEIIVDGTTEADDSEKKKEVKSLHDKNISLNSEVLTDRKIGKENMNKYLKVKELQEEGWKYDKPAAHEILSVKLPPTQRQKQTVYRQQQKKAQQANIICIKHGFDNSAHVSDWGGHVFSLSCSSLKNVSQLYT